MSSRCTLFAAVVFLATCLPLQAQETQDLPGTPAKPKVSVELRLGYEYSSVDNGSGPGVGVSTRTRVGIRTSDSSRTSAFVQFHSNANSIETFNDGTGPAGGDVTRDVIADPNGSRIHQVYADHRGMPGSLIRIGRQEIVLDDARFIGNIDWRMNGQSFDAISIVNKSIPGLQLFAGYINRVNTIKLTSNEFRHVLLVNGRYSKGGQNCTLFGYSIDSGPSLAGGRRRRSATYGARLDGKVRLRNVDGTDVNLAYEATYALQKRHKDDTGRDAFMYVISAGIDRKPINFGAGYAYLTGADSVTGVGFDTLLGTAHKFNGWADQFLATNGGGVVNGLEDIYVYAGTNVSGSKLAVRYHWFDTTESFAGGYSGPYGRELDVLLSRKLQLGGRYPVTALLKYAYYTEAGDESANPTADERVLWFRMIHHY